MRKNLKLTIAAILCGALGIANAASGDVEFYATDFSHHPYSTLQVKYLIVQNDGQIRETNTGPFKPNSSYNIPSDLLDPNLDSSQNASVYVYLNFDSLGFSSQPCKVFTYGIRKAHTGVRLYSVNSKGNVICSAD